MTNLIYLLRYGGSDARKREELLRMAEEQLVRVSHITKQTLGFYNDSNVPEVVDPVRTVEELLSILRSRIDSKRLSVERDFDNVGPLNGSRGELRQVFSNLMRNAIDASPIGGEVIVRVKPDTPPNGHQDTLIRIEVEDFGCGIRPDDRARVFEPFFTTKQDFGTGLGLWVSKQLVEKYGGKITFRSTCQEGASGTCFSILLPAYGIS